jgi:hypothetical protein
VTSTLPPSYRSPARAGMSRTIRKTPAADETRAHRRDVDARLVRASMQQSGASGALPVTQPDHPDSLHGLNYVMPNPGRQRNR